MKNVGLELALVYAWMKWNNACQEALLEHFTMGEPTEETLTRVERLEDAYNHLVEAKRTHAT